MNKENGLVETLIKQKKIVNILIPYLSKELKVSVARKCCERLD